MQGSKGSDSIMLTMSITSFILKVIPVLGCFLQSRFSTAGYRCLRESGIGIGQGKLRIFAGLANGLALSVFEGSGEGYKAA